MVLQICEICVRLVKYVIAFLFRITLSLSIPLLSIYHSYFLSLLSSFCHSCFFSLLFFSFPLPLLLLSYCTYFIFLLLSVCHSLLLYLPPSTFTLSLTSVTKNHKNCMHTCFLTLLNNSTGFEYPAGQSLNCHP